MQQDNAGKSILTAVRCEDCGAGLSEFLWSPGAKCPNCGSTNFVPVPIIERVSDYSTADRSQGFAIEDIRLGRLALWAGFLTTRQMQRALYIQKEIARAKASVPDLGTLLVREKLLTRHQVRVILDARSVMPGDRADTEFAQAALHNSYVTESQLADCRKIQAAIVKSGRDAPALPLLLYEKRYMQEKFVLALLKAMALKEKGLLYHIQSGIDGKRSGGVGKWLRSDDSPLRQPRLIVPALLILVMIFYWVHRVTVVREFAHVECTNCHALSGASIDSAWPLICSECGKQEVYPLAICLDCGTRFPVKSFEYGTRCPECGGARFSVITNKNAERLASEVKARLEAKGQE